MCKSESNCSFIGGRFHGVMQSGHKVALDIYGITLILLLYLLRRRFKPRNVMFSLFAFAATFVRSFLHTSASAVPQSPAAVLMESAGSRAGSDAHQAQELRVAASAWLSVVR